MSKTLIEFFDISTYVQYTIVSAWIGLCLLYYFLRKLDKSSSNMSKPKPELVDKEIPMSKFVPTSSSTPLPGQYENDISQDFPVQEKSSCNPGRMTINPWLNFLRHFRTSYCGIRRQNELFQKASEVWRNMSDIQKEPFRLQAEHIRSMRNSGSLSD